MPPIPRRRSGALTQNGSTVSGWDVSNFHTVPPGVENSLKTIISVGRKAVIFIKNAQHRQTQFQRKWLRHEKCFDEEKRHYHNHRCSPTVSRLFIPGRENLRRVTYGLIHFEVRGGLNCAIFRLFTIIIALPNPLFLWFAAFGSPGFNTRFCIDQSTK